MASGITSADVEDGEVEEAPGTCRSRTSDEYHPPAHEDRRPVEDRRALAPAAQFDGDRYEHSYLDRRMPLRDHYHDRRSYHADERRYDDPRYNDLRYDQRRYARPHEYDNHRRDDEFAHRPPPYADRWRDERYDHWRRYERDDHSPPWRDSRPDNSGGAYADPRSYGERERRYESLRAAPLPPPHNEGAGTSSARVDDGKIHELDIPTAPPRPDDGEVTDVNDGIIEVNDGSPSAPPSAPPLGRAGYDERPRYPEDEAARRRYDGEYERRQYDEPRYDEPRYDEPRYDEEERRRYYEESDRRRYHDEGGRRRYAHDDEWQRHEHDERRRYIDRHDAHPSSRRDDGRGDYGNSEERRRNEPAAGVASERPLPGGGGASSASSERVHAPISEGAAGGHRSFDLSAPRPPPPPDPPLPSKVHEPLAEFRAQLARQEASAAAASGPLWASRTLESKQLSQTAAAAAMAASSARSPAPVTTLTEVARPQLAPPSEASASPAPPAPSLPEPAQLLATSAPPPPPAEDEWVSVHDSASLWQLVQHGGGDKPKAMHPDAQPAPPGVLDLPESVLTLTAIEETRVRARADAPCLAPVRNAQLLSACWLDRHTHPSVMVPTPPTPIEPWAHVFAHTPRRLIVLCGATIASTRHHPLVIEHAALLASTCALSDAECTRRGGCDSYTELWALLEQRTPFVLLQTAAVTRRARKQLLHRLSKQPAAAEYAWEALGGSELGGVDKQPGGKEAVPPTLEEGWASVHVCVHGLALGEQEASQATRTSSQLEGPRS